jgi:hypothetical protein
MGADWYATARMDGWWDRPLNARTARAVLKQIGFTPELLRTDALAMKYQEHCPRNTCVRVTLTRLNGEWAFYSEACGPNGREPITHVPHRIKNLWDLEGLAASSLPKSHMHRLERVST